MVGARLSSIIYCNDVAGIEITRRGSGRHPDFLCKAAGIALRGAGAASKANICYANSGAEVVVLYLLTQLATGSIVRARLTRDTVRP